MDPAASLCFNHHLISHLEESAMRDWSVEDSSGKVKLFLWHNVDVPSVL